jgi:cell division protein FtsA
MSDGNLIVACDFGSTTFRGLVAETAPDGTVEVIAGTACPAEGFQDGDFVDVKAGSLAIARLVRELQEAADVDIRGFGFNVAGSHLRSVSATGQIPIGPGAREITDRDVEDVMTMARSLAIPFNHRILTVNPIEFSVDRVAGIQDPRGRRGSRLEVKAHLITGSCSVIRNIENAVEKAGFEPAGHAVDVLATAASLLSVAERQQGVLLVDVGGAVTTWAAVGSGRLLGVGALPWGGLHLTADLASGLRIAPGEAEAVKCDRGVALRSLVEDVDVNVLFEQEDPEETPGLVAAILEPRLEEVFSLVKDALGPDLPLSRLGAGIVLTGGGSRCRGSRELCEEVFGLPVRARYVPASLRGSDRLPAGQWATALGLAMWSAGRETVTGAAAGADGARPRLRDRLRRWLGRKGAA